MIILRAIGGFFVRIGRWIKNTAWVQPLLIVGGIFAIIFSIPYISSWVSSWFTGSSQAVAYYNQYRKSLNNANENDSEANKLFDYMLDGTQSQNDKFFILFVQDDCSGCETIYKGFETLQQNWNQGEFVAPSDITGAAYHDFKLYTVFVDEQKEINNENKNLFKDYFFNQYDVYLEDLMCTMQETNYYQNMDDQTGYENVLETMCDPDKFATPTLMLFDPNGSNTVSQLGVSEVLFTVDGKNGNTGAYPIARTLYDCWYHQDIFGPNYNK